MGNCHIGLGLTGWMGLGWALLLPETEESILGGITRVDCSVGRAGKQVCGPNPEAVCAVGAEREQIGLHGKGERYQKSL